MQTNQPYTNNKEMRLKLIHLYPEEMNIYGDMGNIITLSNRISRRGIKLETESIGQGKLNSLLDGDIYFMGGGQDNDMFKVFQDFITYKKEQIISEVDKEKVFLLICGAFQLFGRSFLDAEGREIAGLDILPIETKAPGNALKDRCLGNLVTQCSPKMIDLMTRSYSNAQALQNTIVGFENHSGQTYFIRSHPNFDQTVEVAKTIIGKGNNSTDGIEGAIYKNIFGSYCHGSLLPKNPHYADALIALALKNKYGESSTLEPLDDTLEWNAHKSIKNSLNLI